MKVRITRSIISPTEVRVGYTIDELTEQSLTIPLTDTPLTEAEVKAAILENIRVIEDAKRRAGYLSKMRVTDYMWLDLGDDDVQPESHD